MFGFNLKEATEYFFNDERKVIKIIVLYILTIVVTVFSNIKHFSLYYLILFVPYIYYFGYMAKNANMRILQKENNLPDLSDWKNYFIVGIKNIAGVSIYIIPYTWICMAPYLITYKLQIKIIPLPILLLVQILGIVLGLMVIISAQIAFSTNLKFKSFFNFNLHKQILLKNNKLFMQLILAIFIFTVSFIFISVILAITLIGILLIPLIQLYLFLIIDDLYGQFIRRALKIEQNEVNNG